LGASCYDQLQAALVAQRAGATYVAFGSFFRSNIKPHAVSPGLQLLHEAKKSLVVPVVAIGGITVSNAPQLVAAGADAVAVISALFAADDIAGTARQFARFFPAER
jgi:thiamine-phosphate pyrophosphorylase